MASESDKLVSEIIDKGVESNAESLLELSRQIWSHPELCFKEKFAHDALTAYLEEHGFVVDRQYKLETAFRAVFSQGSGGANVGLICEYDALPDIGHACGHNLIAESGVAAALGLKAALQANTSVNGSVTVLGTPAEEGGGGKIHLIDGGAFMDVDVCMMVHPGLENMLAPVVLAFNGGKVTFTGRAAHAAASPWEGINALDAAVNAYNALSTLRQQLRPDSRVHAVITDGGKKSNIIPETSTLEFGLRATTDVQVAVLKEKMTGIIKAAALATGCQYTLEFEAPDRPAFYSSLISNPQLCELYRKHWLAMGPEFPDIVDDRPLASTDMGNVSYAVPSIQPIFSVGATADIHTRDFTAEAMTPKAHTATRCVSKSMAAVGWDVLTNTELLKEIRESYQKQLANARA